MTDTRVPGWSGLAQPLTDDEIAEYEARFVEYEYVGVDPDVPGSSEREQSAQ